MTKELLISQIKSLKLQLAVLEAQVKRLESDPTEPRSFASFQGCMPALSECTEDDIASVEIRIPEFETH
jgi:hypothetical protein